MLKDFKLSGVYKITNKVNGKFYVGSSNSVFSRWLNHASDIVNDTHPNKKLTGAINKYGLANFTFEILELHDVVGLNNREQYYLDSICKAEDYIKGVSNFFITNTYNIKPRVEGLVGLGMSEEAIIRAVRTRGYERIYKVSRNGGIIATYELQSHAAIDNNMSRSTVGKSIKNGKCPKGRDFYFVYESVYDVNFTPENYKVHNKGVAGKVTYPGNFKEVYCYDIYNRFFKKFESNTSVAKFFDVDTSSTCRMIDNPKKKVLHRHGVHLYNLYSSEQLFESTTIDDIKSFKQDGSIKVYTLFHEFVGSFSKESIASFLSCHLHSVSQAIIQNKILKGFYFIKED